MILAFFQYIFNVDFLHTRTSLVAQMVKHVSTRRETQVQSLGQEDPLEKEMAIHSSYSCLGNPMDRGAWQVTKSHT